MTEHEYERNLRRLENLDPVNLLLNKLRHGHSAVNALLLARALRNVQIKPPTEQSRIKVEEGDDPADDTLLRAMRTDQRKLFSERAKLSDRFHKCRSVEQRAANSEEIQIIQTNIERLFKRIRHYKVHGVIPDDHNAKNYVPRDGLALSKKRASLRSNISRQKRIVKELRDLDLDDPANLRKVEKAEDRLMQLKTNLSNVEKAIEDIQQ